MATTLNSMLGSQKMLAIDARLARQNQLKMLSSRRAVASGAAHALASRKIKTVVNASRNRTVYSAAAPPETEGEEKFEYQAEVSRLMDLIVNSLYSSKEIFLRELVSNASDALDKLRFENLTSGGSAGELEITIQGDKDSKTLVIQDNGVGMTHDDLVDALGTIAKSGTASFMEKMKSNGSDSDTNLIGQFGVGFYSAFLVAEKVTVMTKNKNSDKTWQWESSMGASGYVVREAEEELDQGTKIVLQLKEDALEFAESSRLCQLVKTYSEFISFPIKVYSEKQEPKQVPDAEATAKAIEEAKKKAEEAGEEFKEDSVEQVMKTEFETIKGFEVQNENKPLWVRAPREVEEEEYGAFFKMTFKEFMDPAAHTHFNVEGDIEFRSILFVPGMAPFDQNDMNAAKPKNIKLFVKRVFISDEFGEELLPRYLSFIKGVVDSSDLPLNVSREILQEGRVVRVMKRRLIAKSLAMLKDLAKDEDATKYNLFHENFGRNLKLGLIEDKDNMKELSELIRFSSSQSGDSLTSLADYVKRMKENQKQIYFLAASSKEGAAKSPFIEGLLKRGLEVLYLLEPIDEVALTNLQEYDGYKLVDISKEEVDLGEDEDEKKEKEEKEKEYESLTKMMTEILGDKVEKVVVSTRLGESPCILTTSKFGWSANMERIMRAQAMGDTKSYEYMKGRKIMEINPSSPIISYLNENCASPDQAVKNQVELLFDTAMLTSGFIIEEPADFATRIFSMMNMSAGGVPSTEKPKSETKETSSTGKDEAKPVTVDPEVLDEGDPWK